MKITVDRQRCTGHARCWVVAPDLFVLDELGYSAIGPGTEVPEGQDDRAIAAVENCPERALIIEA